MNNADWWANKLAGTTPAPQVGRPTNMPPMPATQQPMAPMPTFQPQQTPSQAKSSQSSLTCPDCGSGNYMSPSASVAYRCYDCGYPISQSGSRYGNLAGAHVEGSAKQATGNDGVSNWNPQGIIGRVD